MVSPNSGWQLVGFEKCLEQWELNEPVSAVLDDMGLIVADWIFSRASNPYEGVQREPGFSNLWFGHIPGTFHKGLVVCCSYWIEEQTSTVRCNMFGTLSWPV
ncbi:hypothetical protein [Nonomuraea sp. LPB2021202275-12-8]|uniref:hypothetical protein n=1 Tax=Nonomuraea sp. LPB2021202275-12-8 TaxID=3120159 RepID=UPI00300DA106